MSGLEGFSMRELFRSEVATQADRLNEYLLILETQPDDGHALEALMRAAHSIKGAARMVDVEPAVRIAHVM
ncbi:MAG: Hpt domain-containing protein, partial [Lysobacteraceae bacterium]